MKVMLTRNKTHKGSDGYVILPVVFIVENVNISEAFKCIPPHKIFCFDAKRFESEMSKPLQSLDSVLVSFVCFFLQINI